MLRACFDDYGAYHRDPRNRLCHEIGIPLIVWSLFALFERVKLGPADLALLVAVPIAALYLRLAPRLGLAAVAAFTLLYALGSRTPWPLAVTAFAAGWAFQFAGHACEGRKPAFLTNVLHLLIGPLWILDAALGASSHARARDIR